MEWQFEAKRLNAARGFLARLGRDRAGNTLAMIAASLTPLLAIIGGGIDMGRSYLSESRLQQACDAGVLAARKKLGAYAAGQGEVPEAVADIGNRFFDLNFADGAYGSQDRTFNMTLEPDYSISGTATVSVPTSVMRVFGYDQVPVTVNCEAQLNFSNTDLMMVLDTTGSMEQTNPGDSQPKIQILRDTVKAFHAQMEASKTPGTRLRYGFLPYSTNVNVGRLLQSDWVVDTWTYHGRVAEDTGQTTTGPVFQENWTYVSGTQAGGGTTAEASCPESTTSWTQVRYWVDPNGQQNWEYIVDGTSYNCSYPDGNLVQVSSTVYDQYRYIYSYLNKGQKVIPIFTWRYKPLTVDVSSIKGAAGTDPLNLGSIDLPMGNIPADVSPMTGWFRGCIEERATYDIDDYGNVDLSRALDLDIDRVPDPADPDTQWRPMFNEFSFERSINGNGNGAFTTAEVTFPWDYLNAGWSGRSTCPTEARKLDEMTADEVSAYVDGLVPSGNTYHDIGMIWGGRLISPTGLYEPENADVDGKKTSRHLIFLTDGETAPRDISYGTYGIEPLDQRRWSEASPFTLTQVVENRFTVACNEVKKRNVTVWVIGFGTEMTDMLKTCAGPGRWFQADNAAQLSETFAAIARSIGDLRISR